MRTRPTKLQTATIIILLAAMLIVAAWLLATHLNLQNIHRVAELIAGRGWLGPVMVVLLHVLAAVAGFIPSTPLTILAGAIWGPYLGTIISLAGLQIGALLAFLIARNSLFPWIDDYLDSHVKLYRRIDDRYITRFVFIARLLPFFIFELVSYGAGLSKITFKHYFWATLLGTLPWVFLLAYTGQSIMTIGGPWILAVTAVFLVLIIAAPWIIEKYNPWNIQEKLMPER
jgi:uncharacterized membrane protein YdjX (TVP38/TMEM64 family)